MLQPMRYIVGSDALSESRPGLSSQEYRDCPSYGGAAG